MANRFNGLIIPKVPDTIPDNANQDLRKYLEDLSRMLKSLIVLLIQKEEQGE